MQNQISLLIRAKHVHGNNYMDIRDCAIVRAVKDQLGITITAGGDEAEINGVWYDFNYGDADFKADQIESICTDPDTIIRTVTLTPIRQYDYRTI